ncbi:MAG: class I SAM-dependent methyltransferase [Proteobacteria bacterium]|nr:class I SAM-dependent methyltransferase [Pseudomonadota bacterium]
MSEKQGQAIAGVEKYRDYYSEGGGQAEWRRMCAETKADNIINLCSDFRCETVLEIGCGSGDILQELGNRGFANELSGIEISSSGLERMKQKSIPGLKEALHFDGDVLPFEDQTFDLVVLSHVVEHLEHPRKMLHEARRVARYVFVEVPLEHTARLGSDFDFNEVGHINFYTAKTIRRLLQTSGLVIENQIVTDTTREMLTFQMGKRGIIQHGVRASALRLLPGLAQKLFVYHSALVARSTFG